MSLSTADHVRGLFIEATRQALTRHLRKAEDFARFAEIAKDAEERIATEQADFREHYTTRLAEAREIILRERTGRALTKPTPQDAAHISDKAVLDAHADRRVRNDHQRRLATIGADERDAYQALRDEIFARDAPARVHGPAVSRIPTRSGPTRD